MAEGKNDYYGVSGLSELPMAQAGSQTPSEDESEPELGSRKRKRPMNVTYVGRTHLPVLSLPFVL
jgi:hypothetical protein